MDSNELILALNKARHRVLKACKKADSGSTHILVPADTISLLLTTTAAAETELLQHRAAAHATGEAAYGPNSLADLTAAELQEYEQAAVYMPQVRRVLSAYKGVQASRQYGRDIINDNALEAEVAQARILHLEQQLAMEREDAANFRAAVAPAETRLTTTCPSCDHTLLSVDFDAFCSECNTPAPAQTPPPAAPRCGGGCGCGNGWLNPKRGPVSAWQDGQQILTEVIVYRTGWPHASTAYYCDVDERWFTWDKDGQKNIDDVEMWQPLPAPRPPQCAPRTCPAAARDAAEAGEV